MKDDATMARSTGPELSLHEVAERLGVHYMTAYRYVRTGQLPARREGGEWRLREADVTAFATQAARRGSGRTGRGRRQRWRDHIERLRDRMVNGDEPGAWQVLERALVGGAEPTDLYVHVLGPALHEVGDGWESGELTIEDEHRASVVATRVIGRLGPRFARPGRRRGTVVLGAAPEDTHALPTAMLADVLRAARYRVIDLGGATPVESFLTAARDADSLVAVGVSASTSASLGAATSVIAAVRASLPGVPILLGGPAVVDEATAQRAGADGWAADAATAVAVLGALVA